MSKKINELLAVLDMPEAEQAVWCEAKEHGNRQMGESLADLAFRLRDEVRKAAWGEQGKFYTKGIIQIYAKATNYPVDWSENQMYDTWFVHFAQPIHWIVAALKAKKLAKENNDKET